jgi:hypothetical protein
MQNFEETAKPRENEPETDITPDVSKALSIVSP